MYELSEIDIATQAIPHLQHQFRIASPILFTGAGFSLGAKSVSGLEVPTTSNLTERLWEIAYPGIAYDGESDLQDVFEAAVQTKKTAVRDLFNKLFVIDRSSIPEYHKKLLSLPWSTVYTLNVDDLIEKGLSEAGHKTESISALRGPSRAIMHSNRVKVIHLNGVLEDAPDGVTFSREQYAARSDDAFFASLVRDLKFNPVVFFGTKLDEALLWKYMHLRGGQGNYGEKELRPRSYLVTPTLNRPKASLLSKFNICWFKATAQEFCDRAYDSVRKDSDVGRAALHARLNRSEERVVHKVSVVSRRPRKSDPSEYLFGAEPTWDDAIEGRISQRPSYEGLSAAINCALRTQTPPNLVVVSGTAGSGKSSAMRIEALQRAAKDIECGWVDRSSLYDSIRLDGELEKHRDMRIVFIEDADLLGARLIDIAKSLQTVLPQMVLVAECRSAKVDRLLAGKEPEAVGAIEFTIPHLGDEDIEVLLDVLSRESRLGLLKGKDRCVQRQVLREECGRQLLVAMYKATQGKEFQDKARDEFLELDAEQQVIYGIAAVSHAHRLYVERDEIAIAFGDDYEKWPQALDKLCRRRLLVTRNRQIRTRHREIAQFIYDQVVEDGKLMDALRGLIKIAGSKAEPGMRRNERPARMLARFISNNLLKRHLGYSGARALYQEFQNLLADNHHYWLHRGALELKQGNFDQARLFLNQSKGIEPNDIFVDVELLYLRLKEAVGKEKSGIPSEAEVDGALQELERIAEAREDQRAHVTHIGASQTLAWIDVANVELDEKQRRIKHWIKAVNRVNDWQENEPLSDIERELKRALLALAT